jgi:hypothetical protein
VILSVRSCLPLGSRVERLFRALATLAQTAPAREALDADLTPTDETEIIGISDATVRGWRKQYRDGGVEALDRRPRHVGLIPPDSTD